MRSYIIAFCAFLILFVTPSSSFGCDLCSIYNSLEIENGQAGSIQAGAAEQFTSYSRLQNNGKFIENDEHQRLSSSITQIFAGYNFSELFSVQASLPYINRRFARLESGEISRGTEAGIGDLPIIARYSAYDYRNSGTTFIVQLMAGIKLPTGNSDRLKEEQSEGHIMDEMPMAAMLRHGAGHDETSAVHGHDLALGSGSVDFPVGARIYGGTGRMFGSAEIQYTIRNKGDHDYTYANDLLWNAGPGYFVALDHDTSVALRANLSGDYKGMDFGNGEKQTDTSSNTVFLGPQLLLTTASCLNMELGWDFPIFIENSGTQAVTSSRIRAGISYRF